MKLFLALFAFFCVLAVATASINVSDLLTSNELAALQRGIMAGQFSQSELASIMESLEAQEVAIAALEAQNAPQKSSFTSTLLHSKYVHYSLIGFGGAIILAAAIVGTIFAVRKFKQNKLNKQNGTEEHQGLLAASYDTVV